MATYADCSYCGGRVIEKRVQKACWWGDRLVAVIDNVPAGVCAQCGQRFYQAATLKRIDQMLEDRERFRKMNLPVAEFAT
ncbi:MAG: YgiT-type zinc finger protein [Verrucomicrobia bacterium]|nr:YgiT-type zinc finger protein [Verrucomicrobiota bacterium]